MAMIYRADLPVPQTEVLVTPTTSTVLLVIFVGVAALIIAGGLYELVRYRSYLLLCCAAGGLLCNVIEPTWDQIGHLWWYRGVPTVWTAYEHAIHPTHYPVWCFVAYILYAGFDCYLFYLVFTRSFSRWTFWLAVGQQWIFACVFEITLINNGIFEYYGEQPGRLFGFPVYWAFTNSGEIFAAAIMVAAIARFGRRGALLAVPIVPAAFAGWILWAGWPVFGALNINVGMPIKWLALVVCAVISVVSVYGLSTLRLTLYRLATRGWPQPRGTTTVDHESRVVPTVNFAPMPPPHSTTPATGRP
jgi:hypothetical protein